MDVDHPEFDQDWDAAARSETQSGRLDRNWSSLLQELRVTQTGVQLLTGFLLTLPFQARFAQLGDDLHTVYLMTVACSLAATVLPSPLHFHHPWRLPPRLIPSSLVSRAGQSRGNY